MSSFWFGIIVGIAVTLFVRSVATENGLARQAIRWVIDKINKKAS